MNEDFNIEKNDLDLIDPWLSKNLIITQVELPLDFTKKVIEKIEIQPNPLSGSPIFWILITIPCIMLLWLISYALGSVDSHYLNFIPKISSEISIYTLSKYVLMITLAGLFFIGIDYYISKRLLHKESFFGFILV
ncbi:MAG TPA: hypothetical protein DIW31_01985 [Bacteroidales bacterium]|nr:hypothetical protein [Bacteroidales bacterium]